MTRPVTSILAVSAEEPGAKLWGFVRVAMVLAIVNAALTGGFIIGGCSHHFRSVP